MQKQPVGIRTVPRSASRQLSLCQLRPRPSILGQIASSAAFYSICQSTANPCSQNTTSSVMLPGIGHPYGQQISRESIVTSQRGVWPSMRLQSTVSRPEAFAGRASFSKQHEAAIGFQRNTLAQGQSHAISFYRFPAQSMSASPGSIRTSSWALTLRALYILIFLEPGGPS
jgi:hypothetical protein